MGVSKNELIWENGLSEELELSLISSPLVPSSSVGVASWRMISMVGIVIPTRRPRWRKETDEECEFDVRHGNGPFCSRHAGVGHTSNAETPWNDVNKNISVVMEVTVIIIIDG